MEIPNFRIDAQDYRKVEVILSRLLTQIQATSVSLINRNGQHIAHTGSVDGVDVQALASLAASNVAATFGLALLIGEEEFQRIYHRGRKSSILITPIGELALVLVVMPVDQSATRNFKSLGQAALILRDILLKSNKE